MSDKPLNARERAYLQPAIVYGWEIEISPTRKTPLWQGDVLTPVKVGPLAEALVAKGYLEKVLPSEIYTWSIRATEKAKALQCRKCWGHSRLYNDEGQDIGRCPDCDNGVAVNPIGGEK
ncbi:hypothetical protein [Phytobacter sp. V91]|uniref:hypothetical protein n=1 Tax=Phytobacter sp. V91 TaxID=3369425 RepID=UPI003F5FE6F1